MKKEMISVIVPIFKVEKYLDRCINSIINQSYQNLEIILVDDGSPDNCPKICDDWAKKDERIKVIHKINGGLSDARNSGLDIASGKYVCFIDSDDFIDKNYIEKLYNCIIENKVLVSQCNYLKYWNESKSEKIECNTEKLISSKKALEDICLGKWYNVVVWNKMYSISLFNSIRFPYGKIHEDEFTTYKIFDSVEKIGIVKDSLYYYCQNDNSIIRSKFNMKRLHYLEALEERMEYFNKKNYNDLYKNTLLQYLDSVKWSYFRIKEEIPNSKKEQKQLKNKFRIYFRKLKKDKISKEKFFMNYLFYISPFIYLLLKDIKMSVKNILKRK